MRIFIDITSGDSDNSTVPARVQNVQAIDMEDSVEISWDEPTGLIMDEDGEVEKYIIQKKVNDGTWQLEREITEIDWVSGFFIMDLNVESGNTYYYRIKAETSLSKQTAWSGVASITLEEDEPTVPETIPFANISSERSFNYNHIFWTPAGDGGSAITAYAIQRVGTGVLADDLQEPEYIDITSSTDYFAYNVAAINAVGQGAWSNGISSSIITNLDWWRPVLTVISSNRIDIAVNNAAEWGNKAIDHYWDIQRSTDQSNWTTIASNQTDVYQDDELEASTTYYYRIVMKNEHGSSSASNIRNATTQESVRGTVTNITYASTYGSGQNFGYKQYVPADYDGNTATPLVIWLHGLGERSQSNGNPQFARLELYGPFKEYKDFEADYPFLMIAPQQPTDVDGKYTGRGSWDVEVIEESLNHFKAQGYNIDLDRVYITGQSMGGGGVLSYINSAYGNDTIAAALPIAATLPQGTGIACNIKHIPIWIFHAENDPTVPSSNSKNLYTAIKACTPAPDVAPKITIFNLSSHTGWNQVYRNTGATLTDYADNSPFPNGTTWEDWLLQYSLQSEV